MARKKLKRLVRLCLHRRQVLVFITKTMVPNKDVLVSSREYKNNVHSSSKKNLSQEPSQKLKKEFLMTNPSWTKASQKSLKMMKKVS